MGVDLETIFDIEPSKEMTTEETKIEKFNQEDRISKMDIESINKHLDKLDSKIKNLKIAKYFGIVAGLSIGIASIMDKKADDTMLNATVASWLICFSPAAEYTLKQPLVQEKEVIYKIYPEIKQEKKTKIKRLKRR